jgi:hypothetical protein
MLRALATLRSESRAEHVTFAVEIHSYRDIDGPVTAGQLRYRAPMMPLWYDGRIGRD